MISMLLSRAAVAVEGLLRGEDVTFTGCSTDSRSITPGQLFIALRGQHFDGHEYIAAARQRGACAALVDRRAAAGPPPLIEVDDTRMAMGRLAGHWRAGFDIPVIALTGSNGKTTVKEMIATILAQQAPVLATRGNLNNDIGVPLTLFGLGREHHYAVIEMGANHPGEIAVLARLARPTVALITQCAPAHLEGFGSVEGVARAKGEIFGGLSEDGIAIINADDAYAGYWEETAGERRRISFGLSGAAQVTATNLHADAATGRQAFTLQTPQGGTAVSLELPGRHNVMNALAAAACCLAVGVAPALIAQGLGGVTAVPGRLQIRMSRGGLRVIDDTYNANPVSLAAALDVLAAYPGAHYLVLGDMGELGGEAGVLHRDAGEAARAAGVRRLYAIGELSRQAAAAFGAGAEHFEDMGALLRAAAADLSAGATVLVKGSRAMGMERIVQRLLQEN